MFDPKLVIDEQLLLGNSNSELASRSGALKTDKQLIRYLSVKLASVISTLYISMDNSNKPKKEEVAEFVIKRVSDVRSVMRFIINELINRRSNGELSCFPDVANSDDFNSLTSFVIDYVFSELYEVGFVNEIGVVDELNGQVFANCFSAIHELVLDDKGESPLLNSNREFSIGFSSQMLSIYPRVMLWFNYFDYFVVSQERRTEIAIDVVKKIVSSALTMKSKIELIGVIDISLIIDSVASIMRETFKSVSSGIVCEFNQLNESERSLWMMQVEHEGGLPTELLFSAFEQNMSIHQEVTLGVFQSLMESSDDDDDHGETGQPFVSGSVDEDYDYESDELTVSH